MEEYRICLMDKLLGSEWAIVQVALTLCVEMYQLVLSAVCAIKGRVG